MGRKRRATFAGVCFAAMGGWWLIGCSECQTTLDCDPGQQCVQGSCSAFDAGTAGPLPHDSGIRLDASGTDAGLIPDGGPDAGVSDVGPKDVGPNEILVVVTTLVHFTDRDEAGPLRGVRVIVQDQDGRYLREGQTDALGEVVLEAPPAAQITAMQLTPNGGSYPLANVRGIDPPARVPVGPAPYCVDRRQLVRPMFEMPWQDARYQVFLLGAGNAVNEYLGWDTQQTIVADYIYEPCDASAPAPRRYVIRAYGRGTGEDRGFAISEPFTTGPGTTARVMDIPVGPWRTDYETSSIEVLNPGPPVAGWSFSANLRGALTSIGSGFTAVPPGTSSATVTSLRIPWTDDNVVASVRTASITWSRPLRDWGRSVDAGELPRLLEAVFDVSDPTKPRIRWRFDRPSDRLVAIWATIPWRTADGGGTWRATVPFSMEGELVLPQLDAAGTTLPPADATYSPNSPGGLQVFGPAGMSYSDILEAGQRALVASATDGYQGLWLLYPTP